MLSTHEQQIWEEFERSHGEEAEEIARTVLEQSAPIRRDGRGLDDIPATIVGAMWLTFFLVLFGASVAALVVGTLTLVSGILWHHRPPLTSGRAQSPHRSSDPPAAGCRTPPARPFRSAFHHDKKRGST